MDKKHKLQEAINKELQELAEEHRLEEKGQPLKLTTNKQQIKQTKAILKDKKS